MALVRDSGRRFEHRVIERRSRNQRCELRQRDRRILSESSAKRYTRRQSQPQTVRAVPVHAAQSELRRVRPRWMQCDGPIRIHEVARRERTLFRPRTDARRQQVHSERLPQTEIRQNRSRLHRIDAEACTGVDIGACAAYLLFVFRFRLLSCISHSDCLNLHRMGLSTRAAPDICVETGSEEHCGTPSCYVEK